MPRNAQKISIAVLVALCVPFLLFFAFRHALDGYTPRSGASYMVRCGGSYVVWMLACAACASLACFIHAGALFYTEWKRQKGHALNGLTISHAVASAACGLAFSLPFWNLRYAPCFVSPVFYAVVVVAMAARALHTIWRAPVLLAVQDVDLNALLADGPGQVQHLKSSVPMFHEDRVITAEFLEKCLVKLHELNMAEGSGGEQS